MRRALLSFAVLTQLVTACSSPPKPMPPMLGLMTSSAFTYQGASAAGALGVVVAPTGTVAAVVSRTASVNAFVYGAGQDYQVVVDGRPTTKATVANCRCWTTVALARGLGNGLHYVAFTNLGPRDGLLVHTWSIDHGGSFLQRVAAADSPVRSIAAGRSASFFVQDASAIALYAAPADVKFDVRIDGRPSAYHLSLSKGQPTLNGVAVSTIAWGLGRGIEQVTISVVSGTLGIRHVVLYQALRGSPRILPDEQALRSPLLAVYGDSVADGRGSLGFLQDSGGFAEQLAADRGWRLSVQAVPGATASCYGTKHVVDVFAPHPNAVIVSFGASDVAPTPGAPSCGAGLDEYTKAMAAILAQLHRDLPGVPIYVQAILPSNRIRNDVRDQWNAALKGVAQAHAATYVDPGKHLFPVWDYADLPNNRGHAKIAQFWNALLPPMPGF